MSSTIMDSTDPDTAPNVRAHVVYETATGKVLLVHHSVVYPSSVPARESPESRACRLAGVERGGSFAVIEVDPAHVNQLRPIQVDLATLTIVLATSTTTRTA